MVEQEKEDSMVEHWDARFGFLIPSGNAVFERDAFLVLPLEATAHFGRMELTVDSPEQIAKLASLAPEAARLVAHADVNAMAFCCTTGSLDGGLGYDRKIIETLQEVTRIPTTTTATATLDAFRHLGVDRISLVSPYQTWLNDKVVRFFGDHGVSVVHTVGFGIEDAAGIAAVSPQRIAEAVVDIASSGSDAVFISCTGMRGLEALDHIPRKTGHPILTSNQVTLWKTLDLAGYADLLHHGPGSRFFGVFD